MPYKAPMHERFWAKVDKTKPGCWEWAGAKNNNGYGVIARPNSGPLMLAHRFSALIHFGMFDQSLLVLHRCDNPACVNPGHLFLGTTRDNMRDCAAKGRLGGAAVAGWKMT